MKLILALALVLALFPLIALADYYSMHGVIISDLDGVSTVLTDDGSLWDFDSEPDLWTGDRVFLVMGDHGTPNDPTDDVILLHWYDPMD